MKQDIEGIEGLPLEPRKNARLKTDNAFPLNKTTSKNRAFLRGFSTNRALGDQATFLAGPIARHRHGWKSSRASFLTLLGAIRYPVSFW